ncbi:MAG: acetyltransferase [Sphingobacteriales bacterium]|nr:MAG: acetyltransferase [Sphingobacteriales bacterium]
MNLYGASGHAKVIIEIIESNGGKIEALFDDNPTIHSLLNYPVQRFTDSGELLGKFIVSIGNNRIRKDIVSLLKTEFGVSIHKNATVSSRSVIGEGTVVMGGVVINTDSHIGRHCIVNTNASIDHDCSLEDFVHIAPGAILCGDVYVGEGTLLGARAVVIPGIRIGKWCTIGAGSVIIKDIPDFTKVAGNPARIIRSAPVAI